MKYLGDGTVVPPQVKAAMAVSVPCDLSGSAKALHALKNLPYHINFKWGLINRLKLKQKQFPEAITKAKIRAIKTLNDFDEVAAMLIEHNSESLFTEATQIMRKLRMVKSSAEIEKLF